MIRKAEREQRQAITRYNQQARQHNAQVKRVVDEYNRDADRYNASLRKQKREVDAYNRKVDAHNARVRRDRQRLINELKRLERQASSTRYVPVQASFRVLNEAYQRVDVEAESWSGAGVALADLAEAETANSAAATNALLGEQAELPREEAIITNELLAISDDRDKRWRGALFSLDSRNPDAARHFCTSAREILTRVIDLEAPYDVVLAGIPNCAKLDDVMKLFRVFNDATHGHAGALDLNALRALKRRVEGAIRFLSAIVRPAT
jgi:Predicted pPIWI-associating nuclease